MYRYSTEAKYSIYEVATEWVYLTCVTLYNWWCSEREREFALLPRLLWSSLSASALCYLPHSQSECVLTSASMLYAYCASSLEVQKLISAEHTRALYIKPQNGILCPGIKLIALLVGMASVSEMCQLIEFGACNRLQIIGLELSNRFPHEPYYARCGT